MPPRPRAVSFMLIVGWPFFAFSAYAAVRATIYLVSGWAVLQSLGFAYISVAWRATLAACVLIMLVYLHRRRTAGRWLGALFIALIEAYFLNLTIRGHDGSVAYQAGAYMAGLLLFCAPVAWWFYSFTLSRKARAWFNWAPGPDAPR